MPALFTIATAEVPRPRVPATYGSAMYPQPAGKDLSEEQARELDDTFLSSDPFQYFRSRIASLLA